MSYILGAIKYIKEEKTSETQELRLNRGNHKWEEDKNAKMKNNRRRKKQKKKCQEIQNTLATEIIFEIFGNMSQ